MLGQASATRTLFSALNYQPSTINFPDAATLSRAHAFSALNYQHSTMNFAERQASATRTPFPLSTINSRDPAPLSPPDGFSLSTINTQLSTSASPVGRPFLVGDDPGAGDGIREKFEDS